MPTDADDDALPPELQSPQTLRDAVLALPWKNRPWQAADRFNAFIHIIATMPGDRGGQMQDTAADLIRELQHEETGLFKANGGRIDFDSVSGAYKLTLNARRLGIERPRAKAVYDSTLRCLLEQKPGNILHVRNAIEQLAFLRDVATDTPANEPVPHLMKWPTLQYNNSPASAATTAASPTPTA